MSTKKTATDTKDENSLDRKPLTLRYWGCGGAGINIGAQYVNMKTEPGCAAIIPAFLDTSLSNINPNWPDVFITEGTHGSGGIRGENVEPIEGSIKSILNKISPGDINIVGFSGSGGSGNVIATSLIAELIARKIPVIPLAILGTESRLRITNSVMSMRTLEGLAEDLAFDINAFFLLNEDKWSKVDALAHAYIGAVALMTSDLHHGLDMKDVVNFLRPSLSTKLKPRLNTIQLTSSIDGFEGHKNQYSIMSLYNSRDADRVKHSADYDTVGYCDFDRFGKKDFNQIHLLINDGIQPIYDVLNADRKEAVEARAATVERASLASGDVVKKGRIIVED
jgi:hypothetical protein